MMCSEHLVSFACFWAFAVAGDDCDAGVADASLAAAVAASVVHGSQNWGFVEGCVCHQTGALRSKDLRWPPQHPRLQAASNYNTHTHICFSAPWQVF